MRALIAGIGYINLRDSSVGPVAIAELKKESWPSEVSVEDLSYGPIAVFHNLTDASPRYDRLILITAADFGATPPALRWSRWHAPLPESSEVQRRIEEALSGVIDWKNLLVVLQQFEALPAEVLIIAVQPVETTFGMELSPGVLALMPEVLRLARELATSEMTATAHV